MKPAFRLEIIEYCTEQEDSAILSLYMMRQRFKYKIPNIRSPIAYL